jgi:hypothetical protein
MTPKLTTEMREALRHAEGPVEVEGDDGVIYFLVRREDFTLEDDALRRALQVGLDQADRGESQPWDVEAFLAEAKTNRADRSA